MPFSALLSSTFLNTASAQGQNDMLDNASYTTGNYNTFLNGSAAAENPYEICFNRAGDRVYICNRTGGSGALGGQIIYTWSLATPWDIGSTHTFLSGEALDVGNDGCTRPSGMSWSNDGLHFAVVPDNGTTMLRYDCSTAYNLGTATLEDSRTLPSAHANCVDCCYLNGDSEICILSRDAKIRTLTASTLNLNQSSTDILNISGVPSFSSVESMTWAVSGDRVLITDETGDNLMEFGLTTPYNVSTMYYIQKLDVNSLIPNSDTNSTSRINPNSMYADRWNWNSSGLFVVSDRTSTNWRTYKINL